MLPETAGRAGARCTMECYEGDPLLSEDEEEVQGSSAAPDDETVVFAETFVSFLRVC